MRIGIIAIGRSGGCNLGKWISGELGYEFIHEPVFNGIDIRNKRNVVTKFHIKEWMGLDTKPVMDKWIGLIRENERETAISNIKAEESGEWHLPYKLNENWIEARKDAIDYRVGIIREYNCLLYTSPSPRDRG